MAPNIPLPSLQSSDRVCDEDNPSEPQLVPCPSSSHASPMVQTNFHDEAVELVPVERARPKKGTDLVMGNVVLTCPIHPQTLALFPADESDEDIEFCTVRYSAVTCEPERFEEERFTLRQKMYLRPRQTELVITVHLSDETGTDLARTLNGIFANIEFICQQKRRRLWKHQGWKKCVVYILADGRGRLSPGAQSVLTLLGVWQPLLAVRKFFGRQVVAHLFEHTTRIGVPDGTTGTVKPLNVPVQIVLCVNEIAQGQIRSFRWFLHAIAPVLNPESCAFVPVGTRPHHDALYRLWERLEWHPMCGGAVGQIDVESSPFSWLFNPLAAAHGLKMRLNGILDTPFKSGLGFAAALPTELSIFRMDSVLLEREVERSYQWHDWSYYLSQRRLWALEFLSARQGPIRTDYVYKAKYYTPAAVSLEEYTRQNQHHTQDRINLALNTLREAPITLTKREVGIFRKLEIFVLLLYLPVDLLVSWFAIGNTFLAFFFLNNYFTSAIIGRRGAATENAILTVYTFLLVLSVVWALSYPPQKSTKRLKFVRALFISGWILLAAYILSATIVIVVYSLHDIKENIRVSPPNKGFSVAWVLPLLAIPGIWLLSSSIFLNPLVVFQSGLQYILCHFAHVNMINISTFTLTGTFAAHQHAVAERLDVAVTKPNGYVDIGLTADVFANEDLDNRYTRFLQEVHEPASAKDSDVGKRELEHRGPYPDKVVLAWALSNLLLCAVVLNTIPFPSSAVKKDLDGTYTTPKTDTRPATTTLLVIFGLVGSLEAVKFVGTLWFLIKEIAYSVL